MKDPRISKLADLLVNYSVKVQPDDWVIIYGHMVAEPLVSEVLRSVLEAGGNPQVIMDSDDIEEYSYKFANDEQLKWISPTKRLIYEKSDVWIALRGFDNDHRLIVVVSHDVPELQLRPDGVGIGATTHS